MKKYLLVVTITLGVVLNVKNAFSQGFGGPTPSCPQKALVKKYTEFTDSLARFFTNLKNTTDADDYASFVETVGRDSSEAFNVFGSRSTGLKDSMNALSDSLNDYDLLLHSAIDSYSLMSVGAFYDTLSSRITCFLADTTINTLEYLIEQCFGTGTSPNRVQGEGGPCEDAFRSALTSARATYNYGNIACVMAGGTCSGYWRILCIGGCLLANAGVYNENKIDAFCDYRACLNVSCPFN